jgi:hypothetical protein
LQRYAEAEEGAVPCIGTSRRWLCEGDSDDEYARCPLFSFSSALSSRLLLLLLSAPSQTMVPPPLRPQPQRQRSLSTTSLSPAPLSPSHAYSYARQYLSLLDATEQFSLEREHRTQAVKRTTSRREQLAGELKMMRKRAEGDGTLRGRAWELEEEYQQALEAEEQAKKALNGPTIAGLSTPPLPPFGH